MEPPGKGSRLCTVTPWGASCWPGLGRLWEPRASEDGRVSCIQYHILCLSPQMLKTELARQTDFPGEMKAEQPRTAGLVLQMGVLHIRARGYVFRGPLYLPARRWPPGGPEAAGSGLLEAPPSCGRWSVQGPLWAYGGSRKPPAVEACRLAGRTESHRPCLRQNS